MGATLRTITTIESGMRPEFPPYAPPPDTGLPLLHADDDILILDKPAGLLSVPGRGEDKADCLASRVQQRFPEALIVHRLDMETSGLIVMARNAGAHRTLSAHFELRRVDKRYVALAGGVFKAACGTIDLPLITDWPNRPLQKVDHDIGKPSSTRYEVLSVDADAGISRVRLEPLTGRSHQLRVHLMSIGHAILGDQLYAPAAWRTGWSRLMLHAEALSFPHPASGKQQRFCAACPF